MKTVVKTFLPVALLVLSTSAAHSRIWSDVTGEYRFEAELTGVTDGVNAVTLIGNDGKEYNLPIEALSKKDRAYIAKAVKKGAPARKKKMGIEDIPAEVMYKLQLAARRLWPEDEDAQADDVATKAKEYLSKVDNSSSPATTAVQAGVPSAVVQQVRRRAQFQWPDDRQSQDAYVKTQLGCYRVLKKYKNPKMPQLAIVQLKQNARDLAADDYQAQLRYVHSQVQQGIAYLDGKREAELEAAQEDQIAAKADSTTKPIALASVLAEPPASLVSLNAIVLASPAAAPLPQFSPPQGYAPTTAWARTPQASTTAYCTAAKPTTMPMPTAKRSTKPTWKWFGRMQRN